MASPFHPQYSPTGPFPLWLLPGEEGPLLCLYVQVFPRPAGFCLTPILPPQWHEGLTVRGGCLEPTHSAVLNRNIFFFHVAVIFNILKNPVCGLWFF